MDIHVYLHNTEITELLKKILKKEDKIMATMQDLRAAVERNTSVDDSVIAMLQGISQQLKEANAQNDPQAIQDLISQLDANTQKMSDAVKANTVAEDEAEQPQQ